MSKAVTRMEAVLLVLLIIGIAISAVAASYTMSLFTRFAELSTRVEDLASGQDTIKKTVDWIAEEIGKPPPPKEYACPYCPAVFKTEADLAAHIREAHPPVMEVKIGGLFPFTGPAAEVGKLEKMGIEFALDEINAAGGIKSLGGAKLSIVYADHGGDPKTGALECERLITAENVVAMIGSYYSSVTKTSSEVAERYKVPYLNPDSTSPALTERGYKWFFRTSPYEVHMMGAAFELLDYINEKNPGIIKTIGVLHEDSEWGMSIRDVIKDYASKHGYEIIKIISFHSGAASFDVEVTTMKAADPDCLFALGYTTDGILMWKTIRRLDYNPKMIIGEAATEQPAWHEAIGDTSYYTFSAIKYNWDLVAAKPKIKEVLDAFKARTGVEISNEIARPYLGIYTLYEAIEKAGKVASPRDLEAFRAALRDAIAEFEVGTEPRWMILPWKGIKFDEKGQNALCCGTMVQMMPEDGRYHTVWPKEFATAEPIVPKPTWKEMSA